MPPRLRRGRLLVGLIVVTLCSIYFLVARRLPRHANTDNVPGAPADEEGRSHAARLSGFRLQEVYVGRSKDHNRDEWDRKIKMKSKVAQRSGGEVDQPSARKRTLTGDGTGLKKSPITDHMSLLIERHMKDMMNKSLAVIKGFDKESYLAPQRMKNGEGDPMMKHKFNQISSDSTPCNRPLQDYRHPSCWNKPIKTQLPKSTIIICFHNEARSALLRTIVSVLSRSSPELIEEVLLVDDYSDDVMDGELLTVIPKVRLVRLQQRQGLIRARIAGVKAARGEILVFLDSHCEATTGWLEPLVARIVENEAHVVSPVIDIINKDTMIYTPANSNIKGGFTSHLTFRWEVLSKEEVLQRKDDPARPIRTPSIAGGLFAISKRYFEHIGVYDPGMEIWGGENIEMSLRVWMCGGVLEIIPCSRVGHIFRSSMPYGFGTGKTYHSTVTKNLRRLAEVWMGVYKEVFYRSIPIARTVPIGDISDRQELKEKLQCRSFKWFVDNIYPEFKIPSEESLLPKQLKQGGLCLQRNLSQNEFVTVATCEKTLHQASNQAWLYSEGGTLRHHNKCLTTKDDQFTLSHCSNSVTYRKDQEYVTEVIGTGQFFLKHKARQLCVSVEHNTLALRTCSHDRLNQYWQFIT